ncbi:unnamed protein product [Meganyctiphanes norvegica]|uniref:Uncharacterized protein n=1 Tax=Meganyctiphanes norvegica TaxID=48144 RepID=A0AAV2Q6U9_MEGNR
MDLHGDHLQEDVLLSITNEVREPHRADIQDAVLLAETVVVQEPNADLLQEAHLISVREPHIANLSQGDVTLVNPMGVHEIHDTHLQEDIFLDNSYGIQEPLSADPQDFILVDNADVVQEPYEVQVTGGDSPQENVRQINNEVQAPQISHLQVPQELNLKNTVFLPKTEKIEDAQIYDQKEPHGANQQEDLLLTTKEAVEAHGSNLTIAPFDNTMVDEDLCVNKFQKDLLENSENVQEPFHLLLDTEVLTQTINELNLENTSFFGKEEFNAVSKSKVPENITLLDDALSSGGTIELLKEPINMRTNTSKDETVLRVNSNKSETSSLYNFADHTTESLINNLPFISPTDLTEMSNNAYIFPLLSGCPELLECKIGLDSQKTFVDACDIFNICEANNKLSTTSNNSISPMSSNETLMSSMSKMETHKIFENLDSCKLVDTDVTASVSNTNSEMDIETPIETFNKSSFDNNDTGELSLLSIETDNRPSSAAKSSRDCHSHRRQPSRREHQGLRGFWSPTDPLYIRSQGSSLNKGNQNLSEMKICYAQGPSPYQVMGMFNRVNVEMNIILHDYI